MSIKPHLGWLALLLFTTTAQAEGARELFGPKDSSDVRARGTKSAAIVASVTPKTKAPPRARAVVTTTSAVVATGTLTVVETTTKPRMDYEAEIYSGVPLDSAIAKEHGYDKGLVTMVFEHERRAAYRVGREHIRRVVRLAVAEPERPALVSTTPAVGKTGHVDVVEVDNGSVVVVDTSVERSGLFTSSDVYVFPKNTTLDKRVGLLERLTGLAHAKRARLREALVTAEWTPATPKEPK